MKTFILIAVLANVGGAGYLEEIRIPGYTSLQACEAAGKKMVETWSSWKYALAVMPLCLADPKTSGETL